MAASGDVRDILQLAPDDGSPMTKDALFNQDKKKKTRKSDGTLKRPEGMARELWGLLYANDRCGDNPPIIPTDTGMTGYKQLKANIGRSKPRPWKWMAFTNPARTDGAIFYHWRRIADEGKDYPFARFNKTVDVPMYSDMEYQQHLHDENWSRQETNYLFEMCKRFDLRFIIIHDRYDREKYSIRTVEDLKERYFNICNILTKIRAQPGIEPKLYVFDAEHERHRKDQLNKLFSRTVKEIEEEQQLISELKKIETRKKEREKKTMDLQKLIMAADTNPDARKIDKRMNKKKLLPQHKNRDGTIRTTPDTTGIKFPDFKGPGVSLRSQRMKIPAAIGQKKMKAIEQVLDELGCPVNPIPSEDIVTHFNELRSDIVLLYELKLAMANCEYELQTLRHQFEAVAPDRISELDATLANLNSTPSNYLLSPISDIPESPSLIKTERRMSETIDVVGLGNTPNRKRRAAIEQSNIMKKVIKQKSTFNLG